MSQSMQEPVSPETPAPKIVGTTNKPDGGTKRPTLSIRQKRLVKARVLNPDDTLDQIAIRAGYADKSSVCSALSVPHVAEAVKTEREKFAALMESRRDLSREALLDKVAEGLQAKKSRTAYDKGGPDHAVQHKYLETALELRGATRNKEDLTSQGPVNIGIVLSGGGTEQERQAIIEVMGAARRARGMHPTENRRLVRGEEGFIEDGETV